MPQASLFQTALALHQQGKLVEAEQRYRLLLEKEPQHADALALLGTILSEQKKHDAAIAHIRKALQLDLSAPLFHLHLGNACDKAGRYAEAEAAFLTATQLAPNWAEACYNLANALRAQNKNAEAKRAYEKTLALNPAHALAHNNLAVMLLKEGALPQARALVDAGRKHDPDNVTLLLTLNGMALEQGDVAAAAFSATRACAIKFGLQGAHLMKALCDIEQFNTRDAETSNCLFVLGVSCLMQGKMREASFILRSLMAAEPDLSEPAVMMGSVALNQNQLELSNACYSLGFMLDPSTVAAPWNRAMPVLTKGDLGEGFRLYRWRWQTLEKFKPIRLNAPYWDGGDLSGKTILVQEEQGFGDSLQMLRFLPLLKKKGARVYFYARAPLFPLIENWPGVDKVLPWKVGERAVPKDVDVVCGVMDLPGLLGAIPASPSYLPNPLAAHAEYQLPEDKKCRIGLNWSGNPLHKRDVERSIPYAMLEPVLRTPNVSFYSFQFKPDAAAQDWMQRFGITDLAPRIQNMAGSAAFMGQMDLLITVDSAPAHLAGGLGVPVWVLVTFNPDWRWLLERADSPWYPSLRLFRQPAIGDWDSVIGHVCTALTEKMPNREQAFQESN